MRHRLFIGSSKESLAYAESVQKNLSSIKNLEIVCWPNLFKTNHYTLEDLLNEIKTMSFGVFVLAPDDYIKIRKKEYLCARDNVILELGMFLGALGRDRTFFLVPEADGQEKAYRIPSDLMGINPCTYYIPDDASEPDTAVSTACINIKRIIEKQIKDTSKKDKVEKFGVFTEFDSLYSEMFATAGDITTFFIHSYRWRETNMESINDFFERDKVHWNVILPDITDSNLLENLQKHFSDGKDMVSKVVDAYTYFNNLAKKYPKKLNIRLFNLYPVYTFYRFDNKVIVSLYPLTPERRPTPTFLIDMSLKKNSFFVQDFADIMKASQPKSTKEMDIIINQITPDNK